MTAADHAPRRSKRVWLVVLLVTAGTLNYVDRQIIAVLKPLLQSELHWSDSDYGYFAGITQFASAVAFLGAGWCVDRLGWRRANPLAVASWSIASLGHVLAHGVLQFTAVRLLLGATESLSTPATIKTIGAFFQARERSLVLGVTNMASNLGAIVTPLAIPALALAVGWRLAFLITCCLGLLWVAVWLVSAPRQEGSAAVPPPPPAAIWRDALSDRGSWGFIGAKAWLDQVWWCLLFWLPDLFNRMFHLDMRHFGAKVAAIYAMAATGSLLGGFLSGRMMARGASVNRARKVTLLLSALLILPVPLVMLVDNPWVAVLLLGLALAAHQSFSVNLFAVATDIVPNERLGTVISLGAFAGNLAGMAAVQGAGLLLQSGAGYAPMLALDSVSFLLALGWLQLLLPEIKAAASH